MHSSSHIDHRTSMPSVQAATVRASSFGSAVRCLDVGEVARTIVATMGRRSRWQHEPTSSASQPDVVPSKSLPPLGSMDRMANGEHLGQCPTCGGYRWWDNRSRKATGEMARTQPDYACTECRHGRWNDGSDRPGRTTARRTPSATVTEVPTVTQPSGASQAAKTCAALKRDGTPCRNGAMAGTPFCGPHSEGGGPATPLSNQCRGTTKAGKPCRAGAQRGSDYCPQHNPRR
jgi:hypothetical protein